MATIRKRQKKNGIIYDIQVKMIDKGSGRHIVRTTTWQPDRKMTQKQEEIAVYSFAADFEEEIKQLVAGGKVALDNPNITFRDYAASWLEKIKRDNAANYFVKGEDAVNVANNYIGGYKVKELTPGIIQSFFDQLDKLKKTIVKVTPKPNMKEILLSYGFSYTRLRNEKNIQACTLSYAMKGTAVSKLWAVTLCKKTKISFQELFDEVVKQEPYAYESIAKMKRVVKTILAQAKKNRLIADNYASAQYIDSPTKPSQKIKCMDDEMARKFFKTVLDYPDIRVKTAMLIFILTGFRRGEVTGLQWSDINFERNTITVQRSVCSVRSFGTLVKLPKTENSIRTITIAQTLIEQLKEYKVWWQEQADKLGDIIMPDCEWLFFQNNGTVTYPTTFNLWLNDILEQAGLEHFTLHSLRHTNITMQIAAGIPLVTVSARAGHAKTSTTSDIYAHFIRSNDAMAAEAIDQLLSDKT